MFRLRCAADALVAERGAVAGVRLAIRRDAAGRRRVLTCGGFQANAAMMREHFGPDGGSVPLLAPRAHFNSGDGIRMAQTLGADFSGEPDGMHIEPVDPRSDNQAAVVLLYPYGIVVDASGRRFFDEGAGLVHETWEAFARRLHFAVPGRTAFAILDCPRPRDPRLAARHALRGAAVSRRIRSLNSPADRRRCGRARAHGRGLQRRLHRRSAEIRCHNLRRPRRVAVARAAEIELGARHRRAAVPRLAGHRRHRLHLRRACDRLPRARVARWRADSRASFAAGEITGHFYGTAPNAVSVLRAFVFGRIAGREAVESLFP